MKRVEVILVIANESEWRDLREICDKTGCELTFVRNIRDTEMLFEILVTNSEMKESIMTAIEKA